MEDIKRNRIHDVLVSEIHSGAYAYGDSFPGVKALMARFSSSYVTACRVLRSLANEGYLLCRSRSEGYTVCYIDAQEACSAKKLNIVTESTRTRFVRELLGEAEILFGRSGWEIRRYEMGVPTRIERLLEILNEPNTYSIIVGINVPWQRFIATLKHLEKRVLVIGRISHNDNISTVVCDEQESVKRILDYLFSSGRSRPMLFLHDPGSELENIRAAAWRKYLLRRGLDFDWIEEHIIPFEKPVFIRDQDSFFENVLVRHGCEIDSVVIPLNILNFIHAARNLGILIPRDILPITIGLIGEKAAYTENAISYLDNNPAGHLFLAHRILEYRHRFGTRECGYWFFCPPGRVIEPEKDKNGSNKQCLELQIGQNAKGTK